MYKYVDYLNVYGRIMQFNKNKREPVHRWYPFVEGYSKEFIQSILSEMKTKDIICLEPFSGSGTTALELQNSNIPCFSFEVNPLMYLVSRVKLEDEYNVEALKHWNAYIEKRRREVNVKLETSFGTLYQSDTLKKWNYNTEVALAIAKLKKSIEMVNEDIYQDLFKVALASILLDVSNLYRNGKCLSYKKNWKNRVVDEKMVFEKFDKKVRYEMESDIECLVDKPKVNNKSRLYNKDSRVGIDEEIDEETIDLVITSPPYLNSRDYTDTYMLELKSLGFAETTDDIKKIREQTLRSHVQIKWKDNTTIDNCFLNETLEKLEMSSSKKIIWNDSIIDMVRLYFVDIKKIFHDIYKKMKNRGRIYFNVSNSSYFSVLINTLEICASIAESEGFTVLEIRKARYLKTSPQQQCEIDKLLEGVIVLEK